MSLYRHDHEPLLVGKLRGWSDVSLSEGTPLASFYLMSLYHVNVAIVTVTLPSAIRSIAAATKYEDTEYH